MLSQIASASRRAPICQLCRARAVLSRTLVNENHARYTGNSRDLQRSPARSYPRPGGSSFNPNHSAKQPQVREIAPYKGRYGKSGLSADSFIPDPPPSYLDILQILLQRLPDFLRSDRFRDKIEAYGISLQQQQRLSAEWRRIVEDQFTNVVDDKSAIMTFAANGWDSQRFMYSFGGDGSGFAEATEAAMLRKFVVFASTHASLSPALQSHLGAILESTDLTRLPFTHANMSARSMTREFHLHIGPTNSGKTYNALTSLAKAETGAYAGPLRLLAHEVWERLNLGTVGGLDGEGKPCNLLTGEERRIVDPDAGLISCTVEMIPLAGPPGGYDVVVIDEIQMLGDVQRGGAWTHAVLGVRAKEIHMCGDETTVELLQDLIKSLGDNLTIHRYERLTPLTVADESLNGDLSNVQKGDCVVTFSRNNIYAVKKMIESTAGKKCAVIYGALPPETRAEQAREFNDENSQCEILVASDAVGMGLNLKINRIVFESLEKYNGRTEVPLALTQIKQIAGRAGRFGMQRKSSDEDDVEDPVRPDEVPIPGGVVTTLHATDLPILREVLPMQLPTIKQAVLDAPFRAISDLSVLLPPGTPFSSVLEHLSALSAFPKYTTPTANDHRLPIADTLEPYRNLLSLTEMDLLTRAPANLRDPIVSQVFPEIVKAYAEDGLIEIGKMYSRTRLLAMLDLVEATLATLPPLPPIIGIGRRVLTPPIIITSIPNLESMHKTLVLYIWLSFRLEVAFPERNKATQLKTRVETVLEECLQRFPGLRNKKHQERTKQGDRAVAQWRKQYVAPNGTKKMPGSDPKGIKWVEEAVIQRLKNKQVWQSTGVVPYGRVLKEADGKGPLGMVVDMDAPEYHHVLDEPAGRRRLAIGGGDGGDQPQRGFGREYVWYEKRQQQEGKEPIVGNHGFGLKKQGEEGKSDEDDFDDRKRPY